MFKAGFEKIAINWAAGLKAARGAVGSKANLMAGTAAGIGGGIHGAFSKDQDGNRGGISGAVGGAAKGFAGGMAGHALFRGGRAAMRPAVGGAQKLLSAPKPPTQTAKPMRDVTPGAVN
jgi:hypothetical protein